MGDGVLPLEICWYCTERSPCDATRDASTFTSPNACSDGRSNTVVQSVQPLDSLAATILPRGITRYALSLRSSTILVRWVWFGGIGTSILVHFPSAARNTWNVRPYCARCWA